MWKKKTAVFIASQACSILGTSLVQYALFWYVTLETKSGVAMTAYIVCGFLPTFFLSPFGGVWADRFDRKKLIMIADGFIAAVTLILAAVFMINGKSLAAVLVASALRAAGTAVQAPAVGAILPGIVPTAHLTRVNGISTTIQSIIALVAPVVSGVLVSVCPLYVVFLIDVVTAAGAILILGFFLDFTPAATESREKNTHYFTDMKLGFLYIKEHRYLVSLFMFIATFLFLITPAAMLTPLQVARTFGSDVWRLTAIEVAFSAGMILGGALISIWGGWKNRMVTILVSSGLFAICSAALGIVPTFVLYTGVMVLLGLGTPFFHTPLAVMLQEHVDDAYLGRVFSVSTMLTTSVMPMSMLIFGPLSEKIRIEILLVAASTAMLICVAAACTQKQLFEAGRAVKSE